MQAAALRGRDRYYLGTCAVFERGEELVWDAHYLLCDTPRDLWAEMETAGWRRVWTTDEAAP